MRVLDVDVPFGVAHRGSRLLWPENTMEAFSRAIELGFEWLETDVHLSADGVLVCIHDPTLDRTTNGTGLVRALTATELARLDAGHHHAPEEGFPYRGRGVGIPTLEELVLSFPDVRLVVELKEDGLVEAVWSLIERLGLHDHLIVGSFSDGRLARFRAASGGRVATSTGRMRSLAAYAGAMVWRSPRLADAVQFPLSVGAFRPITRRSVQGFHRAGLQVHVWTVNDRADMERLLDIGVDAIITDRPDLLGAVLADRARRSG